MLIGLFVVLLQGCGLAEEAQTPSPTTTLLPFVTDTATATVEPPESATLVDEEELLPSPTPFVHEVQEGETLLSIALRYGVTLDGMLAANPGLDPRFLSIGQELRIPGPEGQPADTLLPTSTPLPLVISAGQCYRTTEGGWICLAEVENITESAVEGLTAKVQFIDQSGELLGSELAFAPLNRLSSGDRLPLLADFRDEAVQRVTAVYSLLSAVESSGAENRYLETSVDVTDRTAADDGSRWSVSGQLALEGDLPEGSYRISLLVMGVDADGDIVGYTKWEPDSLDQTSWQFEVLVYSLGPPIDDIEVAAEAVRLED